MKKLVRLIDFQIGVGASNLDMNAQRVTNLALFSSYEPVRLWLRESHVTAPFRKLVVALSDRSTHGRWHGAVSNVAGVCEVIQAVDTASLPSRAVDHRWALGVALHAVEQVANSIGWRSPDLVEFVHSASHCEWPHSLLR
jgi:hypothetical protein